MGWVGVKSVSVAEVLSHADTLEISCHSPTKVLLQLWNPSKEKDIQAIEAIQWTFTYKITAVQHLNYMGTAARTQIILSPETPWTLYNYIYLEDNTACGPKYWWYNGTQKKTEKIQDMELRVLFSIQQTETQHNPFKKMQ